MMRFAYTVWTILRAEAGMMAGMILIEMIETSSWVGN